MAERVTHFLNSYECDNCGSHWTDEWCCACNDRCPICNLEIEPNDSLELVTFDLDAGEECHVCGSIHEPLAEDKANG